MAKGKSTAVDPFSQGQEVSGDASGWNFQWKRTGQRVMGRLLQFKPFRNGHKCKVDDELTGTILLFSAPQNLAEKLELVRVGDRIGIEYVENRPSAQASPFKVFRVVKLPALTGSAMEDGDDEKVPF